MDSAAPRHGTSERRGPLLLAWRQGGRGLFGKASPWWVRLRAVNALALAGLGAGVVLLALRLSQPVAESPDVVSGPEEVGALEEFAQGAAEGGGSGIRFSSRKLFREPRGQKRPRPQRANVTLSELSRKLTLQGILGGDAPRAILLNGSTRQVLYLAAGEFVGEIQVAEIRKNSVLLSWKDETLELIL